MKHLLERTKREFVVTFKALSANVQIDMMTTQWRANTQLARWRRLHVKTMNDIHIRELKDQAGQRKSTTLPVFLRPAQIEPAPQPTRKTYQCKYCPKSFVLMKRRRIHVQKYHQSSNS